MLYKIILINLDTISPTLRDLVLRSNTFDTNTFSHTSHLFDGVRTITGKLDLQNSRFQLGTQLKGNCLFDLFQRIRTLDLSSVQFESISNETNVHLAHLLKCRLQINENRNGEQLLYLYLRQLNLQNLPEWFTPDRFPLLRLLDLSKNNFYSIDISNFTKLSHVSFAYNPVELRQIGWREDTVYESIDLRSTIRNDTFRLSHRLGLLFKLTQNLDYSENEGGYPSNITDIPIKDDFIGDGIYLNISRTNVFSFQLGLDNLRRLDISFNSLIELNLDKQTKLNYLDCSNQYLIKLTLNEELLGLNELKCSNNSLTTVENFSLLKNTELRLIDLSMNVINSLENLILNLDSRYLRTINLRTNLIEIIPAGIFHQKLVSLYEINLSWNKIHTIKKNAFQSPNLQILDLTGNPLKTIEPKAIFTASLRLFFVFNDTQQLTNRCIQSKSPDNLLLMYLNWFQQNGTMMKNISIPSDKCLTRYMNSAKSRLITKTGKHILGFYSVYVIIGASSIGIFFGAMYCYRKNKLTILGRFQRYKQLDRDVLVENEAEMDQHRREDDEIVMNLEEPPYNKFSRVPTNV